MRRLRLLPSALARLPRAGRLVFFALVALLGAIGLSLPRTHAQTEPQAGGLAVLLDLDGAVTPATAD